MYRRHVGNKNDDGVIQRTESSGILFQRSESSSSALRKGAKRELETYSERKPWREAARQNSFAANQTNKSTKKLPSPHKALSPNPLLGWQVPHKKESTSIRLFDSVTDLSSSIQLSPIRDPSVRHRTSFEEENKRFEEQPQTPPQLSSVSSDNDLELSNDVIIEGQLDDSSSTASVVLLQVEESSTAPNNPPIDEVKEELKPKPPQPVEEPPKVCDEEPKSRKLSADYQTYEYLNSGYQTPEEILSISMDYHLVKSLPGFTLETDEEDNRKQRKKELRFQTGGASNSKPKGKQHSPRSRSRRVSIVGKISSDSKAGRGGDGDGESGPGEFTSPLSPVGRRRSLSATTAMRGVALAASKFKKSRKKKTPSQSKENRDLIYSKLKVWFEKNSEKQLGIEVNDTNHFRLDKVTAKALNFQYGWNVSTEGAVGTVHFRGEFKFVAETQRGEHAVIKKKLVNCSQSQKKKVKNLTEKNVGMKSSKLKTDRALDGDITQYSVSKDDPQNVKLISRTDLDLFAHRLMALYNTKHGTILDELCENLVVPPGEDAFVIMSLIAAQLVDSSVNRSEYPSLSEIELLILRGYTQKPSDIDRDMGFADVPDIDSDSIGQYEQQHSDWGWTSLENKRNGSLYAAVCGSCRDQGPMGNRSEASAKTLRKWIKTICLLMCITSTTSPEPSKSKLFRGLGGGGLPEAVVDYHRLLKKSNTLAWTAPSSTSFEEQSSRQYMLGTAVNSVSKPHPEKPGTIMFTISGGVGLNLQTISQYPAEAEVLVPPLTMFDINSVESDAANPFNCGLNVDMTCCGLLGESSARDIPILKEFFEKVKNEAIEASKSLRKTALHLNCFTPVEEETEETGVDAEPEFTFDDDDSELSSSMCSTYSLNICDPDRFIEDELRFIRNQMEDSEEEPSDNDSNATEPVAPGEEPQSPSVFDNATALSEYRLPLKLIRSNTVNEDAASTISDPATEPIFSDTVDDAKLSDTSMSVVSVTSPEEEFALKSIESMSKSDEELIDEALQCVENNARSSSLKVDDIDTVNDTDSDSNSNGNGNTDIEDDVCSNCSGSELQPTSRDRERVPLLTFPSSVPSQLISLAKCESSITASSQGLTSTQSMVYNEEWVAEDRCSSPSSRHQSDCSPPLKSPIGKVKGSQTTAVVGTGRFFSTPLISPGLASSTATTRLRSNKLFEPAPSRQVFESTKPPSLSNAVSSPSNEFSESDPSLALSPGEPPLASEVLTVRRQRKTQTQTQTQNGESIPKSPFSRRKPNQIPGLLSPRGGGIEREEQLSTSNPIPNLVLSPLLSPPSSHQSEESNSRNTSTPRVVSPLLVGQKSPRKKSPRGGGQRHPRFAVGDEQKTPRGGGNRKSPRNSGNGNGNGGGSDNTPRLSHISKAGNKNDPPPKIEIQQIANTTTKTTFPSNNLQTQTSHEKRRNTAVVLKTSMRRLQSIVFRNPENKELKEQFFRKLRDARVQEEHLTPRLQRSRSVVDPSRHRKRHVTRAPAPPRLSKNARKRRRREAEKRMRDRHHIQQLKQEIEQSNKRPSKVSTKSKPSALSDSDCVRVPPPSVVGQRQAKDRKQPQPQQHPPADKNRSITDLDIDTTKSIVTLVLFSFSFLNVFCVASNSFRSLVSTS